MGHCVFSYCRPILWTPAEMPGIPSSLACQHSWQGPPYAAIQWDEFDPWPLNPCAKRPRLSTDCELRVQQFPSWEAVANLSCMSSKRTLEECIQEQDFKRQRLYGDELQRKIGYSDEGFNATAEDVNTEGPSTFCWGDLPSLPSLSSNSRLPGEIHQPCRDQMCNEGTADQPSTGCSPAILSACRELVPYRVGSNIWTTAPWCMTPQAVASPSLRISVAEVLDRGHITGVLPDFAVPLRSESGTEEQVVPWKHNLAIVLYKEPNKS